MDERLVANRGTVVAGGGSGFAPGRPAPAASRAPLLARVRASRVFSECLVTRPSESIFYVRLVARFLPIPLALVFIAFVSKKQAAPPWLAPVALVACAAVLIFAVVRVIQFRSAPLVRRPALVVDVRRVVERHRRHTTVRHFVTLAFETAAVQEFEVTAAMAAGLASGRGGVATERDGVLLQFRSVDA